MWFDLKNAGIESRHETNPNVYCLYKLTLPFIQFEFIKANGAVNTPIPRDPWKIFSGISTSVAVDTRYATIYIAINSLYLNFTWSFCVIDHQHHHRAVACYQDQLHPSAWSTILNILSVSICSYFNTIAEQVRVTRLDRKRRWTQKALNNNHSNIVIIIIRLNE